MRKTQKTKTLYLRDETDVAVWKRAARLIPYFHDKSVSQWATEKIREEVARLEPKMWNRGGEMRHLSAHHKQKPRTITPDLTRRIKYYLQYSDELTIEQICIRFRVSRSYVDKLRGEVNGQTISQTTNGD